MKALAVAQPPCRLLLLLIAVLCLHCGVAHGTRCTPGEAFLTAEECRVCVCGEDGDRSTAFCTRFCPNEVVADEDVCWPGQVFRRACNYCVCPTSGLRRQASCTTRICLGPKAVVQRRFRRAPGNAERCAPNIRFMDDCNLCICSADGIKAHSSCTFAQCPGKPR